MQAILPYNTLNKQNFLLCAKRLGFHQTAAYKFLYIMQESDMDVFPLMGEERINILLYAWQICERYRVNDNNRDWEPVRTVLRMLVPLSLNAWFSEEWKFCRPLFQNALLYCIRRAKDLLSLHYLNINWDRWLNLGTTPYNIEYLKKLKQLDKSNIYDETACIENVIDPINVEDMEYMKQEHYYLIALRLIKLFDCRSLDVVQTLSMRVIAVWNELYLQNMSRQIVAAMQDKDCLIFICHMYLLAIYEKDDVRGFLIDNTVNNIRFYYDNFASTSPIVINDTANMEYTPARLIAITCIRLGLYKNEFFETFIWNSYDTYIVTLFGVVSQAYKSYLLGNLLMDLNLMNEKSFVSNFDYYKRLMAKYIVEREDSELFLLNEERKKNAQRSANNVIQTIRFMTDFESKICKGNRLSNIGNYGGADYDSTDDMTINCIQKKDRDHDRKVDPVFQSLPNNEIVLNYVYKQLASRSYKGWHFAKIVTLLKLIGLELSSIEKWRYHPGLTTEFMLNLDIKVSQHYEDLAKIFEEHWFLEQEFWLTSFYLNPTQKLYDNVMRCGTRFNKRRLDDNPKQTSNEKSSIAKFGLLSSSIDVKEIVNLTNNEALHLDYKPLYSALYSLCLPDNMIKDILTVIFLPRNKSFSWVINWNELRKRCKMLLKNANEKRRFIELNMAEANDRLKFLKIDYEKYRNRPQLDYGTIEEGYECHIKIGDYNDNDDNCEEIDTDDFEDEEDNYTIQKRNTDWVQNAMEEEYFQHFEDEANTFGKRRTRSRTAALANAGYIAEQSYKQLKTVIQSDNEMRNKPLYSVYILREKQMGSSQIPKKYFKDYIIERPTLINSTPGFHAFPDIWNVSINEIRLCNQSPIDVIENSSIIQQFIKLHKFYLEGMNDNSSYSENSTTDLAKKDFKCDKQDITSYTETIHTKNATKSRMLNLWNKIINTSLNDAFKFNSYNSRNTSKANLQQYDVDNNESSNIDCKSTYQLKGDGIHAMESNDIQTKILHIANENNLLDINADSNDYRIKQEFINHVTNLTNENEQITNSPKNTFDDSNSKKLNRLVSKLDQEINDNQVSDENLDQTEHSLELKRLEEFTNACMTNHLKVRLPRLSVKDVGKLRQPVVLLQSIDQYSCRRNRRKRYKLLDYTESSDDSYDVYKPKENHLRKSLRECISSDSSNDSFVISTKRTKYTKRGKTPSTAHNFTSSNAKRRAHLIVTPRSANGLKLRISNADPEFEVCNTTQQLNTANEALLLPPANVSNDLNDSESSISALMDIDNPLYEEEIII